MSERVGETITLLVAEIPRVRLFRQNCGGLFDRNGRHVKYGPAPGCADITGIAWPGIRIEIEMKKEGRHHNDKKVIARQQKWGRMIEKHGGIYILADTPEDAKAQLIARLADRRSEVNATH